MDSIFQRCLQSYLVLYILLQLTLSLLHQKVESNSSPLNLDRLVIVKSIEWRPWCMLRLNHKRWCNFPLVSALVLGRHEPAGQMRSLTTLRVPWGGCWVTQRVTCLDAPVGSLHLWIILAQVPDISWRNLQMTLGPSHWACIPPTYHRREIGPQCPVQISNSQIHEHLWLFCAV